MHHGFWKNLVFIILPFCDSFRISIQFSMQFTKLISYAVYWILTVSYKLVSTNLKYAVYVRDREFQSFFLIELHDLNPELESSPCIRNNTHCNLPLKLSKYKQTIYDVGHLDNFTKQLINISISTDVFLCSSTDQI